MENNTKNKYPTNETRVTGDYQMRSLTTNKAIAHPSHMRGNHNKLNTFFGEDDKNQVDLGKLKNTEIVEIKKTRKDRFLYVSLAKSFGNGLNGGDNNILRRMRLDLPDYLYQETFQKKRKFKIKKLIKSREKAAKIVQAWWRETKEKYNRILEQIIKIQSAWKGKFLRKYLYEVIYMKYLQIKVLAIMKSELTNHIRPYLFDIIFSKNILVKDLGDLLLRNGKRIPNLRIIFKNPDGNIIKYSKDFLKQKILIKILKAISQNCLKLKLKNYLSKWRIAVISIKLEEKKYFSALRANKVKLKYYLDKWKRHLPKYKQLLKIKDGFEILSKLSIKKSIDCPISNLYKKINYINRRNALSKLLLSINEKKLKEEFFLDDNNNNTNNFSLEEQNEKYKDKINNLEKYVKELESKIKEKDIIIKEEKEKNEDLNKKIKELENQLNHTPKKMI